MKHINVKFECPEPCEGQIFVVGAVVYPTYVCLVGKCEKCGGHASVPASELLSKIFEVMEDKEPS